jgi:sigma-B regulation protein RsbU (phosphoserine phosphatase)
MTDQKPPGITDEDWQQTPPKVRALLTQSAKRNNQLRAQKQDNLAALRSTVKATAEAGQSGSPTRSTRQAGRGGHLLVVDDNAMNRDMLSRRLKRQGYSVEVAENGREALAMIKTHAFDLVLLDIMMPEMNGFEVLEHVKADSSLAYLPVIMVSAVDDIESVVRCVELGAEDYLFKPFNPVLLRARLEASLEKKWLRDQQEATMEQLDIENKRQADELERARQIQLSMLPTHPPRLARLEIAARQETASEVGGDYYDFFPQANGNLRVAIGDATGHGVASGLMVSMTKASLLATNETGLIALVRKINRILTEIDLGTQLNMALLLLELTDLNNGAVSVRVSGGGIPPIYILRAGGGFEEILISAFPLGVTADAAYDEVAFDLSPGDVILLMSDGLSEMFNPDREILGYGRLMTALQQIDTSSLTAAAILEQVANIGDEWAAGHPLYDDVTTVVIKVM